MSASSQNRPPITKPITSRGQQTRQKLLDAAEEVFGERGYERASIVDITRRAGVAQGTFYVYFADKKAIFVELVRELSHRLRREIAKAVAGLSDRMEIERVGFRTFFTFAHEHRNLYKIVRQAEFVDEELFRWYYRRLAEGYARGLAQAMEAEQIRYLDPECLAYCLMGIADFLGMRWVLWDGESPPDEVFENMMAFIRYGMEFRREAESKETKGGST
uniref:TetR/AcrR family transcriptional regulator n=1 Tax=Caldilinea aerophila TaxID=133453 RepID=A0A7C1FVH7_9CHLR